MQNYKFFIISFFVILFASCANDENEPVNPDKPTGDSVRVTLSIGVQEPVTSGTTRATTDNGTSDEWMKSWKVVAVQNGTVEKIITPSTTITTPLEEDAVDVTLANGSTTFYSFANLSDAEFNALGLTENSTLPSDFDNTLFSINGNQNATTDFSNGIPMSNKQTVDVTANGRIELEVVRMVAKIQVVLTNPTSEAITVTKIGLRDITSNPASIYLLPGEISNSDTGKRNTHLSGTPTRATYEYEVPESLQTVPARSGETDGSQTLTFYVNESEASDASANATTGIDKHFILELYQGSSTSPLLYTFNENSTSDGTLWSTIARNELHVLPITLQKYRIDFYVRPYTAIGVLPVYDMDSEIATINLGLYGHYDIIPRIHDLVNRDYYYLTNRTGTDNQNILTRQHYSTNSSGNTEVTTSTIPDDTWSITAISSLGIDATNGIANIYNNESSWQDGDGNTVSSPTCGWNSTAAIPRIEFRVGNYTGWVIYTAKATFTEKGSSTETTISRRFRITNKYVDLSNLAKKRK